MNERPGISLKYFDALRHGDDALVREDFPQAFKELAPFMLRGGKPELKSKAGTAHILVALDGLSPESPLRSAVVLPLIWKKGAGGGSPLPPRLLELSRSIVADGQLLAFAKGGDMSGDWSLWPDFPYDISGWDPMVRTWDSAWGALAGGLVLARLGFRTRPDVMISASWKDGRLQIIDGADKKAQAAKDCGARTLFLSDLGGDGGPEGIGIERVPFNLDMARTFAKAFSSLGKPPELSNDPENPEQFQSCLRYARAFKRFDVPYSIRNILPVLIENFRGGIMGGCPAVDSMAILASQPVAALLSIGVFRPRSVMMLVGARDGAKMKEHLSGIDNINWHVLENVFDPECVKTPVAEWAAKPGMKILDVTGTTTVASVAAVLGVLDHGAVSVVAFPANNPEPGGQYLPGTEELVWMRRAQ